MLIKQLFSPRNEELLSPEIRAYFAKLVGSDWVKAHGEEDFDEYQEQRAEQEAEALNAEV